MKPAFAVCPALLLALIWCGPACGAPGAAGFFTFEIPDGWTAAPVREDKPGAGMIVSLSRDEPSGREPTLRIDCVFLDWDEPKVSDPGLIMAMLHDWYAKTFESPLFGRGRGIWFEGPRTVVEDPPYRHSLNRVLVYESESGRRALWLDIWVWSDTLPVGFNYLAEKDIADLKLIWNSLRSGDQAFEEFLEKCRSDLPPEFFSTTVEVGPDRGSVINNGIARLLP